MTKSKMQAYNHFNGRRGEIIVQGQSESQDAISAVDAVFTLTDDDNHDDNRARFEDILEDFGAENKK